MPKNVDMIPGAGNVPVNPALEVIPTLQKGGEVKAHQQRLESPDTIKVPLGDEGNVRQTGGQSSAVAVRLTPGGASRSSGKRQKRYDFETIKVIGSSLERQQHRELREKLHAATQGIAALKDTNPTGYAAALDRATGEITASLQQIYSSGRRAKTDIAATMHNSGLDRLLVAAFAGGKVTGIQPFLEQLKTKLRSGQVANADVKVALRAFDALCQRLVLAGGPGELDYGTGPVHKARNLLQFFASALHR